MQILYLINYLGHNQIDENLLSLVNSQFLQKTFQFLYLLSSIKPEQRNCVRFEIDVKDKIRMIFLNPTNKLIKKLIIFMNYHFLHN